MTNKLVAYILSRLCIGKQELAHKLQPSNIATVKDTVS